MLRNDPRLTAHIPYIGNMRVPYWCFGSEAFRLEHGCTPKLSKLKESEHHCPFASLCKENNTDSIEWHPIIVRVCMDVEGKDNRQ